MNVLFIAFAVIIFALLLVMLWRIMKLAGGLHLPSALSEEFRASRAESAEQARALREEIQTTLHAGFTASRTDVEKLTLRTGEGLKEIQQANENRFDNVRRTLDEKLRELQDSNEKRLDEMRKTVDEKLQSTLEKRLTESFNRVSKSLADVQRGLGEMQNLATGVGDLKRMLTNVKDRGTWGEYRLEAILEEILTPEQFARNVSPTGQGELVEFAVKLPGKQNSEEPVWLPIDSKFPTADYERLQEAAERGDAEEVKSSAKALIAAVKKSAKDIHDKYIAPPYTTDFAILFLPTEGLYAEILREPGLHDELQRTFRVLIAGPTNLAAILNSLRVGFQTLAIEKRAHEVWKVLGAVKTEFGKFNETLNLVKKQLDTASGTLERLSSTRTRAMQRQLRSVEELPESEATDVLRLDENYPDLDED